VPSLIGFLPQIGPLELIIVLAIVILILGPKRIPAAFRSLKKGVTGFRETVGSGDDDEPDPQLADRNVKPETPPAAEPREKSKTES